MSGWFGGWFTGGQTPEDSSFTVGEPKIDVKKFGRRLQSSNTGPKHLPIWDSIAIVLHCIKHNRVVVRKSIIDDKSNAFWLPFKYQRKDQSWFGGIRECICKVLSDEDNRLFAKLVTDLKVEFNIIHILRIQLPQSQQFVTRLICLVKLKEITITQCCRNTSIYEWLRVDQILNGSVGKVWGNELDVSCANLDCDLEDPDILEISEFCLEDAFEFVPRDPPRNEAEKILSTLKINEKHVERVYFDFVEHCFPAFNMTLFSFKNYLSKYGFNRNDKRLDILFNAFNYRKTGYLIFHELLLGLASMEPSGYNEVFRLRFVFRYFDVDRDGYLNETEFRAMIKDMNRKAKESDIYKKVKENMKLMKSDPKEPGIKFDNFAATVSQRKFIGTSNLCRSRKQLFIAIINAMLSRNVEITAKYKDLIGSVVRQKSYPKICANCKRIPYEMCSHSVVFTSEGLCTDFNYKKELIDVLAKEAPLLTHNNISLKRHSIETTFNPESNANYLRTVIRAFNQFKGTLNQPKGVFTESKENRKTFVETLEKFATQVIAVLEKEDRCVKFNSPAVVIGDIHGNLEDLLSIEKYLFRSFPVLTANYVFLGDYVDRGKWSVECAVYILALKMLAPNNIFVLRGNHETRVLQKMYTFQKECHQKYRSFSKQVFESLNNIFDRLPLAAVIDESIYCAHGGIPTTGHTIKDIDNIPVNLKQVEQESAIAWEIIWNDPVDGQTFKNTSDILKQRQDISQGFVSNPKRGTAYFFNQKAAYDFLQNNGLSFIIRAHEVPQRGYALHFNRKCITIFSCSHYCGQNNKAAAVFITDQTIRLLELDTTNNKPATDNPFDTKDNK